MPKSTQNEAAASVIKPDMAKALGNGTRSRILMELSGGPLSPSQFINRVGGGDVAEVGEQFRLLAKWKLVEIVETLRGGHRRGGVEHVYRRIQRAHIDTETWEQLPSFLKDPISASLVQSYFARVKDAVDAETIDLEVDRHLSWDWAPLDRVAWLELVTRLDAVLASFPRLVTESIERMARTGEEPIPMTFGLAAFKMPESDFTSRPPQRGRKPPEPMDEGDSTFVISAKMAKAMANKWRSRILMELSMRPLSASQFRREIGGSKTYTYISHCFRQLCEWGYAEVIEERAGGFRQESGKRKVYRRGGVEKIYCCTQRALFDTETWRRLPRFLREEFSSSILHSYRARITEAVKAETFDAEPDRHFTWDEAGLDRRAWVELIAQVDGVMYSFPQLQKEAAERIAATGEKPIPAVLGLAVFRSPKPSEVPPRFSQ
jgi:DNA-binding transcriptional ArsR family regulator